MNLKLSLAIDGGGGGDAAAAVAKKSKVVGGGAVVVDGVGSSAICGGDRGSRWPSLIQSLSDAAAAATSSSSHDDDDNGGGCGDGPVSLRITGFGASADELRETEARLRRFAAGCPNLRFEFEGILNNGSNTRHDCTRIDDDATVVVNLVFPASSREACAATRMAYINSLNPSMVFLIEKHDGGGGLTGGDNTTTGRSASLLPRFAANLRYFAAVFDSLHECLPADSAERLAIERDHLGREIADAVASLDHQHRRRHGGSGGGGDHAAASWNWKAAMEGAGLDGVKLSSRTVSQAKLLLKMKSGCGGGGFRVVEGDGGMAMSLAWRDMALATATLWRRRRRRRRCR
ncbi:hypothetical protein OsJ_14857 [Oryza sativa Japonica Group]|uniref:Uncharacterized protein n=1 Tax=Oryza sativa subsp. japonica TaxID=39947 RepID=A3AU02_ORYSJ|nr:hypothetical protein OsJ_14857 [Oryza sativa Japonica Group]